MVAVGAFSVMVGGLKQIFCLLGFSFCQSYRIYFQSEHVQHDSPIETRVKFEWTDRVACIFCDCRLSFDSGNLIALHR